MLQLVNSAVCWFLSAALLLNNGLPVAVRHAHEVGDDLAHHADRFDRIARTHATSPVRDAERTVAAATEHVHLLWFGWELTFAPPQGEPPASGPSISGGVLLAKVEARDAAVRDMVCPVLAIVSAGSLDVAELNRVNPPPQPRPLASLPLCDTARHLRSGVQLI